MISHDTVPETASAPSVPSAASAVVPAAADAVRLVRVERGEASAEELAAVTALLVARAARPVGGPERPGRSTAGWRRLERTPGFRAPHSWQG